MADYSLPSDEEILERLLEAEGMNEEEFLEEYSFNSQVPGICTACMAVTSSCEPDARKNWCHGCGANLVTSGLVLLGAA